MRSSTDEEESAIGAQIERLTREAEEPIEVEIDGRKYASKQVVDLRKPEPQPEVVKVATLESVVGYIKSDIDKEYTSAAEKPRKRFIHVESPTCVRVLTGIFGDVNQRVCVLRADAVTPTIRLGAFLDPEDFVIQLLTHFDANGGRDAVQALVSSVKAEAVATSDDDGLAQRVVVRSSVATAANMTVPKTVPLRPWRTFAEVAQPESPFVLRLRGGGDGKFPSAALFECDGGRWRLDAIASVRAYLVRELKDVAIDVLG